MDTEHGSGTFSPLVAAKRTVAALPPAAVLAAAGAVLSAAAALDAMTERILGRANGE